MDELVALLREMDTTATDAPWTHGMLKRGDLHTPVAIKHLTTRVLSAIDESDASVVRHLRNALPALIAYVDSADALLEHMHVLVPEPYIDRYRATQASLLGALRGQPAEHKEDRT